LLVFFGIGWALSTQQSWLEHLVGRERFDRWYQTYAKTAATLLPGDRDGDGVCDGLELFLGTDPGKASSCPTMSLVPGHCGFQITAQSDPKRPWGDEILGYLLQAGEQREVHDRIVIGGAADVFAFPPSFRLRLTPPPGVSLATADGPFVRGPLIVPVAADGSIDFEIEASTESGNGKGFLRNLSMANVATGAILFSTPIRLIRAEENAVVAMAKEVHPDNPSYAQSGVSEPEKIRVLRLQWTAPRNSHSVLIEVARDIPEAKWCQVCIDSPHATSRLLPQRRVADQFNDYPGPLKFRIVPFRLLLP
jgi:hypothetical protein